MEIRLFGALQFQLEILHIFGDFHREMVVLPVPDAGVCRLIVGIIPVHYTGLPVLEFTLDLRNADSFGGVAYHRSHQLAAVAGVYKFGMGAGRHHAARFFISLVGPYAAVSVHILAGMVIACKDLRPCRKSGVGDISAAVVIDAVNPEIAAVDIVFEKLGVLGYRHTNAGVEKPRLEHRAGIDSQIILVVHPDLAAFGGEESARAGTHIGAAVVDEAPVAAEAR